MGNNQAISNEDVFGTGEGGSATETTGVDATTDETKARAVAATTGG